MMIGQEHVGVTSIIRELFLDPRHYEPILHFFRSTAWKVEKLRHWWLKTVMESSVLYYENNMAVMIGDGTKKSKEGKKMPCVKRLHQESENSAKPSYIFGHMFGMVGVLAGNVGKMFCVPLSIKIHDGAHKILCWGAEAEGAGEPKDESHVVKIIRDASECAKQLGKSILLLDAYYLSVPALVALSGEAKTAGRGLLSIVVRAKKNATAYEQPVRKPGRGRPPKKGKTIKLMALWADNQGALSSTTAMLYGKEETISFLYRDLLWGKKHYQPLRFVVAQIAGASPIILASNDLTLSPVDIIRLYSYRFKVECAFSQLKNTLAGFAYRFWSMAMPKLKRFAPSNTEPLEKVMDENGKRLICSAFRATQGYVTVAAMALGLLQICSLRFKDEVNASPLRWLRSRSNVVPSEATTADFLRKTLFKAFASSPFLPIIRFILQLHPMSKRTIDDFVA
jgi:hypothetical protein